MDALTAAGVPAQDVRMWNIIPQNANASAADGAERGASIGGVLGGAFGLVGGAAIGEALDTNSGGKSVSQRSGVRLVVDVGPTSPDVTSVLQKAGAVSVRTIDY